MCCVIKFALAKYPNPFFFGFASVGFSTCFQNAFKLTSLNTDEQKLLLILSSV